MNIIIIGGGFNGRLLQTVVPWARVFDWRSEPPAQSARQLGPQYLWEPLRGFVCRRFIVTTRVDDRLPNSASVLRYKTKVEKELDGGDWRAQFAPSQWGYELTLPVDTVEYGRRVTMIDLRRRRVFLADKQCVAYDYLLSTIPLYALLGLIPTGAYEGQARSLKYRPIHFSIRPLNAFRRWHPALWDGGLRVNYVGDARLPWYRDTWRDGTSYRESLTPVVGGIKYAPGKIYPNAYAEGITYSLHQYGIYTFGRFASWHPDELAHETYNMAWHWAVTEGLRSERES